MQVTGKNFIGKRLSGEGEQSFHSYNPVLNIENDWNIIEATKDEVNEVVQLGWNAFRSYRNIPPSDRAAFLLEIVHNLSKEEHQLVDVYCTESGLSRERAVAELKRTKFQLTTFADLLQEDNWQDVSIDLADSSRTPSPKPELRKTVIPLGPVVVFGASNFPFAYSTVGGDTASALAAGCPVIVKSHPMHAGTGELVASLLIQAAEKTGMPNGVFSNLNSSGYAIGKQLVEHRLVKAVGFTGSIQGGRALIDIANMRVEPIPVFAEMGSVNPVFISYQSLINNGTEWAKKYADSITLGAGQFCTSPGLIFGIKSPELNDFSKMLASEIEERNSNCMLHPSIKKAFVRNKKDIENQDGVTLLTSKSSTQDNYVEQGIGIVDGKRFIENPNLHQEVFGSFAIIVECENLKELISIVENLEGQLTGTIIAEPDELIELDELIDALIHRVGRIIYNGVSTGVEVCPSMHHGGPYPASSDSRFSAVGTDSIKRWLRPIAYQNFPVAFLPKELK